VSWVKAAEGAGSLPNILASHSLNADALAAHEHLYRTIMFGDSPLTRSEREAIAVAVSAANGCHY
jgi:alkylhydroperoxidase family enzyme